MQRLPLRPTRISASVGSGLSRRSSIAAENHSWSAKAALQRMVLLKCRLQRMQRFVRADAFNGGDFGAVGLRGEEQTGAHRPAIEHDRARAAHAMLTADMGSDQAEIVAQKIHQRAARLHGSGMFRSVDGRGDRDFFRHYHSLLQRSGKALRLRDVQNRSVSPLERLRSSNPASKDRPAGPRDL